MTTYDQSVQTVESDPETTTVRALPAEEPDHHGVPYSAAPVFSEERQRARFGGVNWGAAFFGWLVTGTLGVLLAGAAVAALLAFGPTRDVLTGQTSRGLAGVAAVGVVAALVVLLVAFYAGGYVAGRMSRFDGGKQGVGVWVTGLALGGAVVAAALLLGVKANAFDRVDAGTLQLVPEIPGAAAVATGVVAVLGSLLAALTGGKVGCRYHRKVDDAAYL